MRSARLADLDCAVAQAAAVAGDWWSLLIIRDVACGIGRFEALRAELQISRKVLSERLAALVEHRVLEKVLYQSRPARYEYRLTSAGEGFLPVLVALQDWGSRWVSGDGSLTATTRAGSSEARRVEGLVGMRVPAMRLTAFDGTERDPIADTPWTVVYCYPGAYADARSYPVGWGDIPGAAGCTLESTTFRDLWPEFTERGATVVGVSTQRPEEQASFARKQRVRFRLYSDQELRLAAALRLPTFRAAGAERLKRLTLVVDRTRTIREVLYPIVDPARSVTDALRVLDRAA